MLKNVDDTKRNMGISLAAAIPEIGGSLAFFLDKILPSEIQNKYDKFLQSLSHDVDYLKIQVSEDIIKSDEFISLFNKTIDAIMCECSELKLTIFRNILLSSLEEQHELNYGDFFLHLLSKLSEEEIKWLFLADLCEKNGTQSPSSYYVKHHRESDNSLVLHITTKLIRYKLINGNKVSNLGRMFIKYINSPNDISNTIF